MKVLVVMLEGKGGLVGIGVRTGRELFVMKLR